MKRYAQLIHLRPEAEAEYVRYHAHVWPSILQLIAASNIRNYSIFLHQGLLAAYFEYHGDDFAADMARLASASEMQRWWSIMDPMQYPLPGAPAGAKWSEMREVFHFNALLAGDCSE